MVLWSPCACDTLDPPLWKVPSISLTETREINLCLCVCVCVCVCACVCAFETELIATKRAIRDQGMTALISYYAASSRSSGVARAPGESGCAGKAARGVANYEKKSTV
jgi:hypothetical protein